MTDTNRLLITADGHVVPEPVVSYAHDERTGRTVVTGEEHYSPVKLILSFDPTTGQVYAGFTEEDALYGPAGSEEQADENVPAESENPEPSEPTVAPRTWQEEAAAAGWSEAPVSAPTDPSTISSSSTPIADSITTPSVTE
jgi:hypothetical protein